MVDVGKTGLLTCDTFQLTCAFPPQPAVATSSRCLPSLTVAGQWRVFTALPVYLAVKLLNPFSKLPKKFYAVTRGAEGDEGSLYFLDFTNTGILRCVQNDSQKELFIDPLKLNAFLRRDTLLKGMFDLAHFGH